MGRSMSCGDSISVSVGFKSHLFTLDCKESCVKHEQSSYGNTEENVKEMFVEDLDSSSSEEDFNGLMIKELGVSLSKTLHIHDPPEPLCVMNSQHQENICNQLEVNSHSLDTDVLEGMNKCATILCSELADSYLANSDDGECATVPSEKFSEAENLAFEQRLPSPLCAQTRKLIPALKGSRARHGILLNAKLNVKWAPEVYDPPVTSSSHTVKGHHHKYHHHHHHHHHCSKAKKEHHNYRYSKGRSSSGSGSGSGSERKHSHQRSSGSSLTDSRILRLRALGCDGPLPSSCSQPKMEPLGLDVTVKSHEGIKYGSSCYMKSFASIQLPVAKAS